MRRRSEGARHTTLCTGARHDARQLSAAARAIDWMFLPDALWVNIAVHL